MLSNGGEGVLLVKNYRLKDVRMSTAIMTLHIKM